MVEGLEEAREERISIEGLSGEETRKGALVLSCQRERTLGRRVWEITQLVKYCKKKECCLVRNKT